MHNTITLITKIKKTGIKYLSESYVKHEVDNVTHVVAVFL